jgi:osmotically-inducible protein OsmY
VSIATTTATPPDQDRLEALIQRRLHGRGIRRLRVLVQQQGLVLQGCAPTYYAKQLAQHAAMEVSGLPILVNEIEVQ